MGVWSLALVFRLFIQMFNCTYVNMSMGIGTLVCVYMCIYMYVCVNINIWLGKGPSLKGQWQGLFVFCVSVYICMYVYVYACTREYMCTCMYLSM